MNYKKTDASKTTISRDLNSISEDVGNIYKTISILAKRSNQIGHVIKEELLEKIDEFATTNNSLEEVFENKEQIEVSRYYERLPKSTSIAIQEMMAARKPLFVWDTPVWDHMGQEYAVPASSVPYWSYECGERLVDKDSLDLALDHFLGRLTTYTPRAYVDRELSPEATVKILTDHFSEYE